MMNYIFRLDNKTVTVRACDMRQARILAMAQYGREMYHAKLVKATNSI